MDLGPKGLYGPLGSQGQTFVDRLYRYGTTSNRKAQSIAYQRPDADAMILQMIVGDEVPNKDRYGQYLKLWNSAYN